MPEISTAGIFQAAFIARHMEQTPRAFFQTTFEPVDRVCAARYARGGLRLQGKWRTRACVPHTPYMRAMAYSQEESTNFQITFKAIKDHSTLYIHYCILKTYHDYFKKR